jgi:hypothetical protein
MTQGGAQSGVRWLPVGTNVGKRFIPVATEYAEVRSDANESQDNSLEAFQSANAPDARSVVGEPDEADALDEP